MEKTIKRAKLSIMALTFRLIIDFFAICILIGIIWVIRDLTNFFTTKLIITNKRVHGKVGLINTNELDSPLSKINGIQIKQKLWGKVFNYGTISITTASTVFEFKYIDKPNEFRTILNNQIERYDQERMEKQAEIMAEAMK